MSVRVSRMGDPVEVTVGSGSDAVVSDSSIKHVIAALVLCHRHREGIPFEVNTWEDKPDMEDHKPDSYYKFIRLTKKLRQKP